MTIARLLEERAKELAHKPFVHCDDQVHSFDAIHDAALRVAANLLRRGVKKGDKIVLLMGNCLEFLYVFLGAGRIGAVVVPVNPILKPDEISYIIQNSDAETLILIPEFAPLIPSLHRLLPSVRHVFVAGEAIPGAEPFSVLMDRVEKAPEHAAEPGDDACLIYTSGTTGMPKGVILTHSNYIWNARMLVQAVNVTDTDRFLCILPLFHVNAQVASVLTPLLAGGDTVLVKKFSPFAILPLIERYRITFLSAVPTIYNVMARMPKAADFDISSIRMFAAGASPLPEETYNLVRNVFKKPFIQGYGLSEATCASAAANPMHPIKWNSVGSPLSYTQVRIVDDSGVDTAPGEVGEVIVAGPTVMKGYYKNPEATALVLKKGWLHTGDLGRIDEEGYLFIVGRVKDMIIRGGQNIYPQQIENVLSQIEGVEECCVVGVEEPRWGQEVLAVIKPVTGVELSENAVIKFCRDKLAGYKCPKIVRFVDQLPKTATGKIKKNEVATQFAGVAANSPEN